MVLELGREERGEMQLLFGNGTSPAGSLGHCGSSKSNKIDDNSSLGRGDVLSLVLQRANSDQVSGTVTGTMPLHNQKPFCGLASQQGGRCRGCQLVCPGGRLCVQ